MAVATIVSGSVHIVGIGTSSITASQAGNGNYLAASDVTKTLTVNSLSSQTITFNALPAKTFGDNDFAPGAMVNSLLPVTYTSSSLAVATIVNGNIHITGAGTTDITASQVGNNTYNLATDVVRTLTVSKSSQIITFNPLPAKKAGDADFDPGATSGSGLIVTYASSNTSIAMVVSGKIHIVGIGTVSITASQSGNSNYSPASDVIQTLTVTVGTAISEIEAPDVQCYPNPVHGILFVKRAHAHLAFMSLIDASGRVMLVKQLFTELESIDVSGLLPGIYVLRTIDGDHIQTYKIAVK
jgi:hypothetical protein